MRAASGQHNILHLVIEGFPLEKLDEFTKSSPGTTGVTKILRLNELNGPVVLKEIFAADTIAVWGKL